MMQRIAPTRFVIRLNLFAYILCKLKFIFPLDKIFSYTDMDSLIVRPLAPPQTHTSDRPIFKNSFDSENSGKLMRYYVVISLIFAS